MVESKAQRSQRYEREHRAQRRAYEETTRRGRRHVDRERMRKTRGKAKRFISWDGEGSRVEPGEQQPYMLFGNSDGQLIRSPRLQTAECLNLILKSPKDAIHFGFAFGYDVNQILADFDRPHLWQLARYNNVRWGVYHIQYIPGKWFQVRRRINDVTVTRKIYDVFHYFNKALGNVLEEFEVGPWQQISGSNALAVANKLASDLTLAQKTTLLCMQLHKWQPNAPITLINNGTEVSSPERESLTPSCWLSIASTAMDILTEPEIIALFKKERENFTWEELPLIQRYHRIELIYMVELMDKVRDAFNGAGLYPTSWHGPGALARQMLKNYGIKSCLVNTRELWPEVWEAARYGFTGGRFQQWLAGYHEGMVYNYDIHSAYPYAIQFLPNLATGKWCQNHRVDRSKIRSDRFCIYHIKYDAHKLERKGTSYFTKCRPRPLFRRLKNDTIYWPDVVEGWYWSPEAELVKNDPAAEFIESWEFEDDGSRPFTFMAKVYHDRELAKALDNPIEYGFKLAMNSSYGQFAQRAGWEQQRPPGPPPFHQLEYAGYVTSMCKAMVHTAASYAYEKGGLITIDTDGVYTTVQIPDHILPNGIGDGLGQWEEAKYQGMIIWQNGFYWLKKDGEWKKARSRGAPRGKVSIEAAWEALETLASIKYDKQMFIGFKLALQQPGLKWRSWTPIPHDVQFGGGPGAKMTHSAKGTCRKCVEGWDSQLHNLHPSRVEGAEWDGRYIRNWSYQHNLPWLEQDEKSVNVKENEEIITRYDGVDQILEEIGEDELANILEKAG